MPHLIVHHTPNLGDLPFDVMLAAMNRAVSESPEIEDEADLKARVVKLDHYRVGHADEGRAFLHVELRILAGRSPEAKADLARRVAAGLREHMPALPEGLVAHLSVEVVDMDRGSYFKVQLN